MKLLRPLTIVVVFLIVALPNVTVTGGNMTVEVIFTPVNEKPVTLTNMTSIRMVEERSKITAVTITFANTPSMLQLVDDFGNHCAVQILRNGIVEFDGDFHNDDTSTNTISLQCWDKLYWINRDLRSFTQTTDDVTASEAFTEAFDSGGTFTYWTEVFTADTYSTPFADDYTFDASRHVVPVDVADEYDDFFDGYGNSGLEFMKSLADAAKRGSIYDYYYWYEYKDGTRYLHFEPSGWGTTVNAPASALTLNRTRNRDNVFNNIHVWGKKTAGYVPADEDLWTESIDRWDTDATTLATSTTNQYGAFSIIATIPVAGQCYIRRGDYTGVSKVWELDNLVHFHYWYKASAATVTVLYARVYCGAGNYYVSPTINPADANWHEVTWDKSDFSVGAGTPEWVNASYLYFFMGGNNADTVTLDHMYFYAEPLKSANTAVTSGYDPTSVTDFGLKETKVTVPWLKTIADCNSIAETLVGYYADIHPVITYSVPYYDSIRLNDNVKKTVYGTEYTLPVHRKTTDMNADGVWTTTIQLGTNPMSFTELINKHDMAIKYNQYDAGLTYNVD